MQMGVMYVLLEKKLRERKSKVTEKCEDGCEGRLAEKRGRGGGRL